MHRYVEGVSFKEAYRQLLELQGDPDYVSKRYAASKLLMQHVLKVGPLLHTSGTLQLCAATLSKQEDCLQVSASQQDCSIVPITATMSCLQAIKQPVACQALCVSLYRQSERTVVTNNRASLVHRSLTVLTLLQML